MRKRAECKEGHAYGGPTAVGGGIFRSVCGTCNAVQLDLRDQAFTPNDLFSAEQRHRLFSPLVEYAALHGESLMEPIVFGVRRERHKSILLARAS
ncbi:MAG: hypothetical protein ACE5MI_06020 [Acidimicrobiia bacterium]